MFSVNTEDDPRVKIQHLIQTICMVIEDKRRLLLSDDRTFLVLNLQRLKSVLDQIINTIEICFPPEEPTVEPTSNDIHAGGSSELATDLAPAEDISLKNYFKKTQDFLESQQNLPEEKSIDLDDFIQELRLYIDKVEAYYEILTTPHHYSDEKTIDRKRDLYLLNSIKAQLNRLLEISEPATEINDLQGDISLPDVLGEQLDNLKVDIEQAKRCIKVLKGNCRFEVARTLNRLKGLLGRIHLYSNTHGPIYLKGHRLGLPTGSLLSSIERIAFAINDAESGTPCTLALLQTTEVSVSRMMYRYEYGLPLGWGLNRVNDIGRLSSNIMRWNTRHDNTNVAIVKNKILLGLSLTSLFWVTLFLTVSGLSTVAKVGISFLTPVEVQDAVQQDKQKVDDVIKVAGDQLNQYREELEVAVNKRIDDNEQQINVLQDSIYTRLNSPDLEALIAEPQTTDTAEDNERGTSDTSIPSSADALATVKKDCSFGNGSLPITEEDVANCLKAVDSQPEGNRNSSSLRDLKTNLETLNNYLYEKNVLISEQQNIDIYYQNRTQTLFEEIGKLRIETTAQSGNQPSNIPPENQFSNVLAKIWTPLFSWSQNDLLNGHINRMMLALLAGAIGSVISLLTRLNELDENVLSSPFFLGLFQPLIGAVMSVVVVAILSTDAVEVINIFPEQLQLRENVTQLPGAGSESISNSSVSSSNPVGKLDAHEVYKILIIGFFIGFSERLAKDTLGRLNSDSFSTDS